ncbi:MAG: glycosyltransferase family 2 protein [Nanoarchaeota archaeon]|nr:glycosyltransferase family 2 protein [Nanoarchaeota archaeon]
MMKSKISVVAPAYNEQGCIEEFVTEMNLAFEENSYSGEIIIVNDASKDKTLPILQDLQKRFPRLRIISHRKNRGLTSSMITGIENARYDIIFFTSSDLESHPREDLPKLINALEQGYDVAIGWRVNKRQGLLKTILSKSFNALVRHLFKVHFRDVGWVRAFRKEVYYNIESMRSDWHRYFVILAAQQEYKIKEVPLRFYPRKSGKSKYGRIGLKRIPGGFLDLLVIKFLTSFSKRPMRMFGSLGAFLIAFGLLCGIYVLYLNFVALEAVGTRVPLVLLTVFLLVAGLQLFGLGFVSELIVSHTEKQKRKQG